MKETKQCKTCDCIKHVGEFHKSGTGYRANCKECRKTLRADDNAKSKISITDVKVCRDCKVEKNVITEFVQNGRDGFKAVCIPCYRDHNEAEKHRLQDEENTIIKAILELARNEEDRLLELTKADFIEKTNGQDVLKGHRFKDLKKLAFKELQKYGLHRDDSVSFGPGKYLVVGDSHGKHTKTGMFDLLKSVENNLGVDKIIHIGHMLDDDGDMSYNWDKFDLTVIPKLDEVYHLESVKTDKDYNFDMVRTEVKIGDYSVVNQDLIQDYVKTPISSLDQQIFPDNVIVNCHRLEMFSRTTYANNDVMVYSAGSLCERHIVKTIKQIDFAGGFTVKETRPEGYSKYRRMRHMLEYWQQGMVLVEYDGTNVTVTPMRVHNIDGKYLTSYFDKIILQNGKTAKPDKKIFLNGDAHVPSHNPDVLQIHENVIGDYKADMYVNVGDFLDGESLNHHAMDRGIPVKGDTLDECAHAHSILRRMSEWAPDCHMIHGNHERFYKDFTSKFPQLNHLLNFKFLSNMEEVGFTSTDIKDTFKIGSLTIIHGDLMFYGQSGSKVEKCSKTFKGDVIIGHVHSPTSRYNCHAMGLTAIKDQGYNEVNASNWVHGFALVNQYKGINFIQNHTIHNNVILLDDTKYESYGNDTWGLPEYKATISFELK
jgi:predicted phosphodiesterase